jgi:RNA polymerase sigma-70 factor, ECF subfamily
MNGERMTGAVAEKQTKLDEEWNLVQRARRGDPEALTTLFGPDQMRLYRTAFSLLRNKEDAEDALQEAMLCAYARLGSFEGRSRFSTWLTRIVLNAALMKHRRGRSRPQVSLDQIVDEEKLPPAHAVDRRPNPEQEFRSVENKDALKQAMDQLSPPLRTAIHLRDIQRFSVKEAARMEGVTVGVIKARSLRARRRLASLLEATNLNW